MNYNQGYHLPPIYGKVLQPHQNEAVHKKGNWMACKI